MRWVLGSMIHEMGFGIFNYVLFCFLFLYCRDSSLSPCLEDCLRLRCTLLTLDLKGFGVLNFS